MPKNELQELGFIPPIIKPYNKDGVQVWFSPRLPGSHLFAFPGWRLEIDGIQWMYADVNFASVQELYSHYKLAYGHVICTGLGFGIKEQWLATKPEVTKITVLEKFKKIINYHKDIGTEWSDKIEIINCDANDYKGSCDFLSIDHYELVNVLDITSSIKKVYKNITCERTWFWPLEMWIKEGKIVDSPASSRVIHYGGRENDIYENYIKIKKYFNIDKLPSLRESELIKFINMFWETQ